MFGYVIIDKPNILMKDYQTYRAYYCGVCKAIHAQNGFLSRFTLNYDIVLLSLLGYNYEKCDPVFKEGRCIVHPVGRKINYVETSGILLKVADINTILGYYKVYDDVIDEGKHKTIRRILKRRYKKSAKRLVDFDKKVLDGYNSLREAERKRESVEFLADSFGVILKAAGLALTDRCDENLEEALFELGKWIYIIDAYDDLKKDFEKGGFNPFITGEEKDINALYEGAEKSARELLFNCVNNIKACYNKMSINVSEGPLSNIIYLGLKRRTEDVLKNRGERCKKIRL